MDFEYYDKKFVPNSHGFINLGATCYFNAIIQAICSLPSFNKVLIDKIEKYKHNKTILHYAQMLNFSLKDKVNPEVMKASPHIWKAIFDYSKTRKDNVQLTSGQQDAGEGFSLFMESIDEAQELQDLFTHRYEQVIHCEHCNKEASRKYNEYMIFDIDPEFKIPQSEKFKNVDSNYGKKIDLNSFLMRQNTHVDKDYKCPKCGAKGEKFLQNILRMLPEVLVVLSKKYIYDEKGRPIKIDTTTDFPEELEFNGFSNGKRFKMIYKAVAQIEHSGSLSSGHYWAVCKRSDKWYTLNDTSTYEGEFKPTENTYIVFYHIFKS